MELNSVLVFFVFLFITTSSAYTPYQYLMHVQLLPVAICQNAEMKKCYNSKPPPVGPLYMGCGRPTAALDCIGDDLDVKKVKVADLDSLVGHIPCIVNQRELVSSCCISSSQLFGKQ